MNLGFAFTNPSFMAPAIDFRPEGAPAMFPFVFIVIACGAASFRSGTSAKQLDKETDVRRPMLGESVLGLWPCWPVRGVVSSGTSLPVLCCGNCLAQPTN